MLCTAPGAPEARKASDIANNTCGLCAVYHCAGCAVQIGIFNHVSYLDAFVVVWAFCVAGVTFHFSQTLPVLGYGVRALQNLYLPPENDKAKQQNSMVQLIKER